VKEVAKKASLRLTLAKIIKIGKNAGENAILESTATGFEPVRANPTDNERFESVALTTRPNCREHFKSKLML
jgi:hypothetical protein